MGKYCDIVPHATGWVYVIDGLQSASYYHTYELAMEAAKAHVARERSGRVEIFRRQALNGEMLPVPPLGGTSDTSILRRSFPA
ncbi:esterase/lipase superfamily enzyme [Neorhizobium sp. 2083]|uniref:hypothetical protein n=1 Tax=Neorhizobium sp. 2083 TaxID=2817762 RepID=UPI0013AFE249|nr:hypothetical protein [Neorhizobium sp. 2083]MDR6817269.1 esterase/lipase superfamily enzyme [Neorhizobium sp. 2083]